jgi:hypothetical protein
VSVVTLAGAAVAYAQRGRAVFPLLPRTKKPRYDGGFHTATCDVGQVRAWWNEQPDDNMGMHPGRSDLVAFDVDTPAARALATQLSLYSEPTLVIATGNGAHLYFRRPDFRVGNLWLGGVLLVRGDDGYTVVPPVPVGT